MHPEDTTDKIALVEDDAVSPPESGSTAGGSGPPPVDTSEAPPEQGEHHIKEGMAPTTRPMNSIIGDLNSVYYQLRDARDLLKTDFIDQTTRETLDIKQGEIKTLKGIYESDYSELTSRTISDAIRESLKSQKRTVDQFNQQIQDALENSRFAKASNQVKQLDVMAEQVKNVKSGITDDYLRAATAESLSLLRRDHAGAYANFVLAFSAINLADLTPEEVSKITAQKLELELIAESTDKFFAEQIRKKETAGGQGNVTPQQTADTQGNSTPDQRGVINPVIKEMEAERIAHAQQLAEINKLIEKLRLQSKNEQEAAEAKIKSLEEKFESGRKLSVTKDSETCNVMYRDEAEIETPAGGSAQQSERAIVTLKLDSIQLPYFNGDLTAWEAFRDLFEYLVDKSPKLSDTVKFHQLRSHLKGIAFDTIRGYQLTGTNYQSAWSDLKKRFDRKEDLVDEYIRKFLEVSAIHHKATFMNLRQIIDTTNQMIRALPHLGVVVTGWDPFINLIIGSKLDEETRQEWKQKKGPQAKTNVQELLEWLETRAIELQPSHSDRLSRMLKGETRKHQPKRVFQVTEKKKETAEKSNRTTEKPGDAERTNKCLICGGNHKVRDCFKFMRECAKARTDIIKTLKLCFKCLLKHKIGLCDQEDCNYCGGPHNVMLCYKKENDGKQDYRQRQSGATPASAQTGYYAPHNTKNVAEQRDEEDWDQPSTSKNGKR